MQDYKRSWHSKLRSYRFKNRPCSPRLARFEKEEQSLRRFLAVSLIAFFFFTPCLGELQETLLVNVLDRNGNAVQNLSKNSFRVRLKGKRVEVLDARFVVAPRRIVVLLDLSGSMAGEESAAKWQIAREAVQDLLTSSPPEVPLAMLTFSDRVRDVFDFRQGRGAIAAWLQGRPVRAPIGKEARRTALFDAVLSALNMLQPYRTGDAVYAITDGDDNMSQATFARVKAALLASRVRLFAFFFQESVPASLQQKADSFFDMIGDSGGLALGVAGRHKSYEPSWQFDYVNDSDSQETVKRCTRALNALVNGFWTLDLSSPRLKGGRIRLEVTDEEGKVRNDLRLIYPYALVGAN